jgi:hypothetical protein
MGISERKHGQWILDLALVAAAVSPSHHHSTLHRKLYTANNLDSPYSHISSHVN